jgi:uncharacterized protein (DUF58 family)
MSASASTLLVVPNRNTLGLGAVLAAMWYAGAGQNNGAAYLLCFSIAGISLVSAVHAWANLRGVRLRAGSIQPVFAGEQVVVPLYAEAKSGHRHDAVSAWTPGARAAVNFGEIAGAQPIRTDLYLETAHRGRFENVEMRLISLYPLGLFTARRTFLLPQTYFVYPRPCGDLPLPLAFDPARETHEGGRSEGDDFAGVREWRAGESMRHVDWKAVARGQPLLVKQWSGVAGDLLMLEWEALPQVGQEPRLSQLSQWAITAEQNGITYGLRLPGCRIEPARGEAHFHACMRALAAFQAAPECAADGELV